MEEIGRGSKTEEGFIDIDTKPDLELFLTRAFWDYLVLS